MLNCAVALLDISVPLGLAWLDVLDGDAVVLSLFHQLAADIFRAVFALYGAGLAAPLDDPIEASDCALSWQGKVDLDTL